MVKTIEEILANPVGFLIGALVSVVVIGLYNYFFNYVIDEEGLSAREKLGRALQVFPIWIWTHKFYAILIIIIAFWGGFVVRAINEPSLVNSGFPVPFSKWKVEGNTSGGLSLPNIDKNHHVGTYKLESSQDSQGWTSPDTKITYSWNTPGSFDELKESPIRGIQSRIKISPREARYNSEYIFCHYSLYYNYNNPSDRIYTSTEQHIPFNQWVMLVWDFTGKEWDLPSKNQAIWDNALEALNNDGPSFTYFYRRFGELWQNQKLVTNNYSPSSVKKLTLTCNVSSTRGLVGGDTGDKRSFEGTFYFGDVTVIPYEFTSDK